MKKLLYALCLVLLGSPAYAQYNTAPMYCNSQTNGTATLNGNTIVVNSPTQVGGIFVCGYMISSNGATVTATLGFGTATSAAVFTSLTGAANLNSTVPFLLDTSPLFRGIYVPPGNNMMLNLSTTATVGFSVYFTYQQNR